MLNMFQTGDLKVKNIIVNNTNFENMVKKDYLIFMYILARKLNNTLTPEEHKILTEKARHEIPHNLIEEFSPSEFETLINERVEMGMDDPNKYHKSLHLYNSKNLNCYKGMIP